MTRTEIIDGELVEMSAEREVAFMAALPKNEGLPVSEVVADPVEKLRAFLGANPDVRGLILADDEQKLATDGGKTIS